MDSTEDLGYIQVHLNATLIAISTVLVGLRLYVRAFVTKALGWDDAICFVAYGLAIALSGLEIKAVDYGVGRHTQFVPKEDVPKFFSILTTLQLCYVLDAGLVRLAIVAFLPRLDSKRCFLRWVYATGAITLIITLVSFFFILFECKHVPDIWDITSPNRQCLPKINEARLIWAHAAIGILIDILLMSLPIYIVSTTMRLSRRSIQVLLVFSVGLFALALGIIRLGYILTTNFAVDTTFKMIRVAPWTNAEVHVGLWVGCFPALQPLLRMVGHYVGVLSSKTKGSTGGTGKSDAGRLRMSKSEMDVEAARRSAARYAEGQSAAVSPVSPAGADPWLPYLRSNSIFEEIDVGELEARVASERTTGASIADVGSKSERVPDIEEEKDEVSPAANIISDERKKRNP